MYGKMSQILIGCNGCENALLKNWAIESTGVDECMKIAKCCKFDQMKMFETRWRLWHEFKRIGLAISILV